MSLLLFGASEGGGAVGSFVHADSNGANVDIITGVTWGTAGAATQAGDLALILWTFINTATATDPTSDTFTLVAQVDDGACRSRLLKRICDGTESGDITGWSNSAINRQSAVLYVVRGYSDVAGATSLAEPGTATSHDCPSIGTGDGAATGDSIIAGVSERVSTGTTNAVAPTTPVTFVEHTGSEFGTSGSGGTYTGLADDGLATGQTMPFDPGAWTSMVSGSAAVGWTIALRPTSTAIDLVVQNATQAQSAASPVLTQAHFLAVASATQAQSAGSATLTQVHNLAVAGATQAQSADSPTLTQVHNLTVVGAAQGQAADNVTVNVATNLIVADAGQAQTAQQVALTQEHSLTAQNAAQAQAAGNVALTQVHSLAVQGATQEQAAGSVILTQTHVLTVQGSTQAQTSTTVTLGTEPVRDIVVTARLRGNHVTGSVRSSGLIAGLRSNHITGGVRVPRDLYTGSLEYVIADVTFKGETAASIVTATGVVQFRTDDVVPAPGDPGWVAPDVTERTDVSGGALLALKKNHTAGAAGEYRVWAKVSDNPEVPILKCGTFTVR